MKHPITLRLDPDLLASAKGIAKAENRTLTNFIETLLKQRVAATTVEQGADHIDANSPEQAAFQQKAKQPKRGAH